MRERLSPTFHIRTRLTPGVLGLGVVWALDYAYWKTGFLQEGLPNFTRGHLLRSLVIAISVVCLCWSAMHVRRMIGVSATALVRETTQERWLPAERRIILGVLLLSLAILCLFLSAPPLFSALSREDNLVEWASALTIFAASSLLVLAFARSRATRHIPLATRWTFLLFAAAFFVIGMEEVSWFQRVFDIKTPELFHTNLQHELNLHNFATNATEAVYYFGAFVFFVVFPFLRLPGSTAVKGFDLGLLAPRPYLTVVGAVVCAYNFDSWNMLLTQVAFFGALLSLLVDLAYNRCWSERVLIAGAVLLTGITQAIFLTHREYFERVYEVTEYKEFLIPLGLLLYAVDVYRGVADRTPAETDFVVNLQPPRPSAS